MSDDGFSDRLEALKREERLKRRRVERLGAFLLIGVSLVLATLFLLALRYSMKRPFDLVLALTALAISIALFARGLALLQKRDD